MIQLLVVDGLSYNLSFGGMNIKPVVGYEGHYSVTDEGDVISMARDGIRGKRALISGDHKLRQLSAKTGHKSIALCLNGKVRRFFVHVLVARAFIGPKPDGNIVVDHIDRNPANNNLSNLRYISHSHNLANSSKSRGVSGVRGVYRTRHGRWRASIKLNKREIRLGIFEDLNEAREARYKAERELIG
jgi:hypothetical protein